MKRRPIALSIVVVAMLSGCAQLDASPGPSQGSSNSSNSSPESVPSAESAPAAAPEVASDIFVRAVGLDVVDTDGDVLVSVSYYDSISQIVDGISDATGVAPVVEGYADGLHDQGPGTSYQWDGLTVLDSDRPAAIPETPEWSVSVTGPTAGELSVSTADMVSVGHSRTEFEALAPGALFVLPDGDDATYGFAESEVTRIGASSGSGDMVSHRVFFTLEGSPLALVKISAPDPIGGR